jgi:hypothetical protein
MHSYSEVVLRLYDEGGENWGMGKAKDMKSGEDIADLTGSKAMMKGDKASTLKS